MEKEIKQVRESWITDRMKVPFLWPLRGLDKEKWL